MNKPNSTKTPNTNTDNKVRVVVHGIGYDVPVTGNQTAVNFVKGIKQQFGLKNVEVRKWGKPVDAATPLMAGDRLELIPVSA